MHNIKPLKLRFDPFELNDGSCVKQFGADEPDLPMLEALATLCRNNPAPTPRR